MKKIFTIAIISLFTISFVNAQCTPDPNCIDIDEPGEMCPAVLNDGMDNSYYEQTVTIIPPESVEYLGMTINLSHLKLVSITNIPPGLTYVSNATDDVFEIGSSYCILISGTPTTPGLYQLNIGVEPYILGFPSGNTIVDDTSLSILVVPMTGVDNINVVEFAVETAFPNPFEQNTEIKCTLPYSGKIEVLVFDELGRQVSKQEEVLPQGENTLLINGENMLPGVYFYFVNFDQQMKNGILIKQ